jgi:hypothetical protein
MNKSLRDGVLGINLFALAIVLHCAAVCSAFHNAVDGRSAGVVDLGPTCHQPLLGNYSGLVSLFTGD